MAGLFFLNGEKCYVIPMEKCHGTSSRKEAHHLLMTPVVLMRNILPFQLLFFLVSNLLVFYKRVFSVFVLSNTCLYISWDRYPLTFFLSTQTSQICSFPSFGKLTSLGHYFFKFFFSPTFLSFLSSILMSRC